MSKDPATLSNVEAVLTTHLHLDLNVDFASSALSGSVLLSMRSLSASLAEVILDTRALDIHAVEVDGKDVPFSLAKPSPAFGTALHIPLPTPITTVGTDLQVRVRYNTTKESPAIQWLEPAQTVGKAHPYLFTQCQAIHARSLLPSQDTPAVKITYTADVTAPAPLRVLMSALSTGSAPVDDGAATRYSFSQTTTMPSYLIAMAVGNLEGREVGPRSTVWSEPEVVASAEWEFADTESFIATGEALLTPYDWGRYDLLVLPASFPYGGMENPCLTFVTPTLLAGDRSLVDVVAHEIAHSWMGNLVTTRTWEHFWLNEGWTVFVERKITGRLHGEKERQFSAILGYASIRDSVDLFGHSSPLTALVPRLHGIDPDDAFSSVPYEKGFNFLYYLETLLGGPAIFEPYMRAHVVEFAGKSITTDDWRGFLYDYFLKAHGPEKVSLLDTVDWDTWLNTPGMPPVTNKFDPSLAEQAIDLATRWENAQGGSDLPFAPSDLDAFNSNQKVLFLDRLTAAPPQDHAKLAALDSLYRLSGFKNCEIRFQWQMLALKSDFAPILPAVEAFLGEQGRMKYVRPLYRSLYATHPDLAQRIFKQNASFYHPIASRMIKKDINLD